MFVDYNGKIAIGLSIIIGLFVGGAIVGGVIGYNKGKDKGLSGLPLALNTLKGVSLGIAAVGWGLMLVAVFSVFKESGMLLGLKIKQIFAIGALAFDIFAFAIAPLFGIKMEGIEFELPNKYQDKQYKENPYYEKPVNNNNNTNNVNFIVEYINSRRL